MTFYSFIGSQISGGKRKILYWKNGQNCVIWLQNT